MNNFYLEQKSKMMAKIKDQPTEIIVKAQRLFWKQSFRKTTMDAIAKEMGISKKTLYKHYPSKMDLLEGIFKELIMKITPKLEAILDNEHLPFIVQVRSIHSTLTTQLSKTNPSLILDIKENSPIYFNQLKGDIITHSKDPVQRFFQKGKEEGKINKEIHSELGALLFLSFLKNLMDPTFLQQLFMDNPKKEPNLSELVDQLFSLVFEGVLTDEAKEDLKGLT